MHRAAYVPESESRTFCACQRLPACRLESLSPFVSICLCSTGSYLRLLLPLSATLASTLAKLNPTSITRGDQRAVLFFRMKNGEVAKRTRARERRPLGAQLYLSPRGTLGVPCTRRPFVLRKCETARLCACPCSSSLLGDRERPLR
eukprot:m.202176 g.202176  ORF g.202176 m.202176 type:complete len:146 (-) comp53833_c0_seq11:2072-2509(-)